MGRHAHEVKHNPDLGMCKAGEWELTRELAMVTHLAVDGCRDVKANKIEDCSNEGGYARE
jgi:hypothetical protein